MARPGRAVSATLLFLAVFGICAAVAEPIGIVLIHGKGGTPEQFASYERPLAELGFVSARPEMCWSRRRIYDRTYLACMGDIDAAIGRLKAQGATSFVIAGMSLGANMALGYGARHAALTGVIALAPAHPAEFLANRPSIAASIGKARDMLARGHGDEKTAFNDLNNGRAFTVDTTANIYLSFFGAQSAAVMPVNAEHLSAPLLIVSGTEDTTQRGKGYIFDRAPPNPLNRYVEVKANHPETVAAGRDAVLAWLKALMAR